MAAERSHWELIMHERSRPDLQNISCERQLQMSGSLAET